MGKAAAQRFSSLLPPGEGLGMRDGGGKTDAALVSTRRFPSPRPLSRRERGGRQCGFTLVEAIVVITIIGILASVVAVFIRDPIRMYLDSARRAALTDAADGAMRHISRELQRALPNSVRVSPDGKIVEFVPVRDAGRYRASAGEAAAPGDALDFSDAADGSFDVLGLPVQGSTDDWLVVYNLGIAGADVYAGTVRRALLSAGNKVTFQPVTPPLPLASPGSRFQIVGNPVSFACTGSELRRHADYGFQAVQPLKFATAGDLVVGQVSECRFSYATGALQRNGLVSLWLKLTQLDESVSLQQQFDVDNTP